MFSFGSKNNLAVLVLGLIFVALISLGPTHFLDMRMNESGNMEGCIFTSKTSLCKMTVGEHLQRWVAMFNAIPDKISSIIIFLFLFLIPPLFTPRRILSHLSNNSGVLSKRLADLRFSILPLTSLRRAFATGILNPKIY